MDRVRARALGRPPERVTPAGRSLHAVDDLLRTRRAPLARARLWFLVLGSVVAAALSSALAARAAPLDLADAGREKAPASVSIVVGGLRLTAPLLEGAAKHRELSAAVGVPVVCWPEVGWQARTAQLGFPGAQGFADVSGPTVHLPERLCRQLSRVRSMPRVRAKIPFALLILAHELAHIGGVEDEDEAMCVGARRMRHWARLLGATRTYADRLAHDWTVQDYLAACSRGA